MPGRREPGAGADPSSYVLVLREHDDAGTGYSLELAPMLGGGGAPPRAHGRGSSGKAAGAGAFGGITTRGTDASPGSRAHRRSPAREASTGPSTASTAHGGSPTRVAATGMGAAAAASRARSSPTRGRSPRARSNNLTRAPTPRARGRGTAVEMGTATPPRAHGGRTRIVAARDGGASRGDAACDAYLSVEDYDPAGAAREHILQEMREMIFSPAQSRAATQEPCKVSDAESKSGNDAKSVREVLIPVFLSPKKKGKDEKEDDDTWNRRQIMYIFTLTTTAGLVFLLQPLLPVAFGRWIIMVIALAWGAGSIGLPCGLHGTARCEKECSRQVGRLIYTLFSVLVIYGFYTLFSVLVIYGFYLAAMRIGYTPAPAPSPSLMGADHISADDNGELFWVLCFGMIGLFVLLGNLWSSVRGCWTGGDRDA
ncbi:unnamed protein product [Urochloa decumbens]|uniref:Uncharacterized protein n=1 Tax=Urochloa decumbens TaxID=240449 RepID=A0ABC9HGR5_9POAL